MKKLRVRYYPCNTSRAGIFPGSFPALSFHTAIRRREAAHLIRIPSTLSWYVVMQCVVVIIGLSAALYYENSLAVWAKLLITALIIYSTLTAGGLLDGKRWAISAEYVRMVLILGVIIAIFYTHTWLVAMLISGVLLAVVSVVWV